PTLPWRSLPGTACANEAGKEFQAMFGQCDGKILLTPGKRDAAAQVDAALAIFDCSTMTLKRLPDRPGQANYFFLDLTAQKGGYHFARGRVHDGVVYGEYDEVTKSGKLIKTLKRQYIDTHDVVALPDDNVYMTYVL